MPHNQRRIERHQLPYYLKVFNAHTDQPIGWIGNISLDGMMLISELPMLVGGEFSLRIKLPRAEGGLQVVDFRALCQWCNEDVTPGHFDSGFSLGAPPVEYVSLVASLTRYFSFQPISA